MTAVKSVKATFKKIPYYLLSITPSGDGFGKITSNGGEIDCGNICSVSYLNKTVVTLTATPNADSTFGGWTGGGCSGTAATCKVTMTAAKSVKATFKKIPLYLLTVTPVGSGKVTSSPTGIDCGADCTEPYLNKTIVTLTATPDATATFTGWSVGCTGKAACKVTMTVAKKVTATFKLK
jgi:hypothetical protein